MAKRLLSILAIALIVALTGCNDIPQTQDECLEQGLWKYDDACVDWDEIPIEDQEMVLWEVVDEIAVSNDISYDEALQIMWEALEMAQE